MKIFTHFIIIIIFLAGDQTVFLFAQQQQKKINYHRLKLADKYLKSEKKSVTVKCEHLQYRVYLGCSDLCFQKWILQLWLNEFLCVKIFLVKCIKTSLLSDICLTFSIKDFSESERDVCGWVEAYSSFQSVGCCWKTLMNSFHFLPLLCLYSRSLQRRKTTVSPCLKPVVL